MTFMGCSESGPVEGSGLAVAPAVAAGERGIDL
jgi:hypothetical protein